jgi:RNA 2',3'-cyclic 3'-phosphodiesterase
MPGDLFGEKADPFGAVGEGRAALGASLFRQLGPVFFALNPDAAAIDSAMSAWAQISRIGGLSVEARPAELLHVTLLAIGRQGVLLSAVEIEAACKAADAIDLPSFEMTLDLGLTFATQQPKTPIVLAARDGAPKSKLLRQALSREMRRRGVPCDAKSSYTPHMTLCYDRKTVEERAVAPVRWMVREFVLIHSHYGRASHKPLGTWKLRSGD